MSEPKSYDGSCFCRAVQFRVTGEPAGMGYCHCKDCRLWSAGPVNAFTLWKPDQLQMTKGAENIRTHNKTSGSSRKWCAICGGHLFTDHPQVTLVDVYAATIPSFPFKPGVHVNYESTVLRMKDGLPKFKDFPKEIGGSGEVLAE